MLSYGAFTSLQYPAPPAAPAFDTDAQAYIDEVIAQGGTLDSTQQNAINDFYVGLKTDSLYSEILLMYPFTGGTIASHTVEGKAPTTAANDITWVGPLASNSAYHTSNGIEMDGAAGGGNVGYSAATLFSGIDNVSMGVYGNRLTTNDQSFTIGTTSGTISTPRMQMNTPYDGNTVYSAFGNANFVTYTDSTAPSGFWIASRTSTTLITLYKNGSSVSSNTSSASTSLKTQNFQLFAADTDGTSSPQNMMNADIQFVYFGNALDSTQVANMNTRVTALQTALSRN